MASKNASKKSYNTIHPKATHILIPALLILVSALLNVNTHVIIVLLKHDYKPSGFITQFNSHSLKSSVYKFMGGNRQK